jgi:hypothetical protein
MKSGIWRPAGNLTQALRHEPAWFTPASRQFVKLQIASLSFSLFIRYGENRLAQGGEGALWVVAIAAQYRRQRGANKSGRAAVRRSGT